MEVQSHLTHLAFVDSPKTGRSGARFPVFPVNLSESGPFGQGIAR
jgi:hypothetical protein